LFWKTIIFNEIITTIGLESQNAREYPLLFRWSLKDAIKF
jgi:hypothetical protein